MDVEKLIAGKNVLIVDDEPDILGVLIELLEKCRIDTAISFEEGKRLLNENDYDVAILDIMGVRGFDLLEEAKKKRIPALMLTAHALTEENLVKSAEEGASYYAPKDRISEIPLFVADIIEAREKKKSIWDKCLDRLSSFYDDRFNGPDWREKRKEFWEEKKKGYFGM